MKEALRANATLGEVSDALARGVRRLHASLSVTRMSWLTPHIDTECCYLGTTGRRSGRVHEVEIWFGVIGDALYLISGNGPGADWYRNALADTDGDRAHR